MSRFNMPDGHYADRQDVEFEHVCRNENCPHAVEYGEAFQWEAMGFVEGDTGAGILYNEDGQSDDTPPGPRCEHCGVEGDN